jgi:formate/nitrite transporter FocA (FNT family)
MVRDHPLEEPQKSYHTTLEQQLADAEEQLERPALGLSLSALTAGLDLGFSGFVMAVLLTMLGTIAPQPILDLVVANAYTVGFIFVVIGRSELFTEHTTIAVLPVLARRSSLARLLRLWGIVLVANLVGAAAFAAFIAHLGPELGLIERHAFAEIARPVLEPGPGLMFLSAVLAGWLMGLLAWLTSSARDTMSQIVIVWLTTLVIGLGKLHHSITGSVEVLMAVFAGVGPTMADWATFLLWAVLGNAVGGTVFVAVLKYGHVRGSHSGKP